MIEHIEVMVGKLPEWYDEAAHDYALEALVERRWHSNPAYADATVAVVYGYDGASIVTAYNESGDVAFQRETDLSPLFEQVYQEEVA